MAEPEPRERIGSALRALAADLVIEKERVARLRQENKRLRAELEALRRRAGVDDRAAGAGRPRE
jgi:hypothetical protein